MAKITKDNLIPKGLAALIKKEIWRWYQKGMKVDEAVSVGTLIAVRKWGLKNADKSGS